MSIPHDRRGGVWPVMATVVLGVVVVLITASRLGDPTANGPGAAPDTVGNSDPAVRAPGAALPTLGPDDGASHPNRPAGPPATPQSMSATTLDQPTPDQAAPDPHVAPEGGAAPDGDTPVPASTDPGSDAQAGTGDDAESRADAIAAAERFLDGYVDEDGRVVRTDQGDDTVSEAQAYGMLAAVVADDPDRFDAIWTWTVDRLQREDGMLAWRWADGAVVDANPATDADLDAAWALLLAADAFDIPSYRTEARRIATTILETSVIDAGDGRPLLAAGPWAVDDGVVNPSYLGLASFGLLEEAFGDQRWSGLAQTGRQVVADLTDRGDVLPVDWAALRDGSIVATSPPSSDTAPVFSYDAARLPIRLATSCRPWAVDAAASMDGAFSDVDASGVRAVHLPTGEPASDGRHPVTLIAAAATAAAADRAQDSITFLRAAEQLDNARPSYYGSAWVALGRALLTTDLLAGERRCDPLLG